MEGLLLLLVCTAQTDQMFSFLSKLHFELNQHRVVYTKCHRIKYETGSASVVAVQSANASLWLGFEVKRQVNSLELSHCVQEEEEKVITPTTSLSSFSLIV